MNNIANIQPQLLRAEAAGQQLERIADVPIYFADAIVRRSPALQKTNDAAAPKAWISTALSKQLDIADGEQVRVIQGKGSAVLNVAIDTSLPDHVVRVAAAHAATQMLGPMFGLIAVEKA